MPQETRDQRIPATLTPEEEIRAYNQGLLLAALNLRQNAARQQEQCQAQALPEDDA